MCFFFFPFLFNSILFSSSSFFFVFFFIRFGSFRSEKKVYCTDLYLDFVHFGLKLGKFCLAACLKKVTDFVFQLSLNRRILLVGLKVLVLL